jgi:hypothetical protein
MVLGAELQLLCNFTCLDAGLRNCERQQIA